MRTVARLVVFALVAALPTTALPAPAQDDYDDGAYLRGRTSPDHRRQIMQEERSQWAEQMQQQRRLDIGRQRDAMVSQQRQQQEKLRSFDDSLRQLKRDEARFNCRPPAEYCY
jgi:hypothetical protein